MISPCFEIECALIQNRRVDGAGSSNRIAEDLAPFGEAAVGGEDHGALPVAAIDGLEEQIAAAGNTRCVSSPLGTLSQHRSR
jgi:hypothetical protein